ncbi:MAG: site-specific integrase [Oscillospiraceae bacterium]|nr:site-specific integrase [Oscillospiraceae bacterium]
MDFDNNKIRIDSTLLYTPDKGVYENSTKTGDTRYLKLPSESMLLLRKYLAWYNELKLKNGDRWHKEYDYCFVRDDGRPIDPDSITAYCSKFSKEHPNLPHINPHAFRHTQASTLISSGQDIVTVAKRLGPARTSTTLDIYSHLIAAADADASECIAEVLLRRRA